MLTTGELKRFAHMRRLRLMDQIWKDYLQDLTLHLLYGKDPGLVFRGGTCIWKLYRGDRFSEDLDLCGKTLPGGLGEHLARELGYLGFDCTPRTKRTGSMDFIKLSVTSPARPRPVVLRVVVLGSEECSERFDTKTLYPPYPDIPPVELRAQGIDDLAAGKVSAILGRDKPRDVHDLYILLRQGARLDMEEVRRGVPGLTVEGLRARMEDRRGEWRSLEPLVVSRLPSLDEEVRFIMDCMTG